MKSSMQQAMFRVNVDLEATFERLRDACIETLEVGWPVESSQIKATLFNRDVTILISKTMVQINFRIGSDEDPLKLFRDAMSLLFWGPRGCPKWEKKADGLWHLDDRKPARLIVSEPDFFSPAAFYRFKWTSSYAQVLTRQIVESILRDLKKEM
jgi:hypothetical protein